MKTLDDFLSNGRMPFVGRADEIERVMKFAAGIADSRGLRITFVVGEAGVGKSRYVEELIPVLRSQRFVVAHVKFQPESNISLDALVADALDRADIGMRLLKIRPEDDQASVVAAIRRLSRLRPTILILEDIEQLQGNSVADFAALVSAVADESLAMLCLARPVELEARGVLERYLVDELTLTALSPIDVDAAFRQMFNAPASEALLGSVMSATHGNALAIRAALRGAIQSGALTVDADVGMWRLTVPEVGLTTLLQKNVRVVSQGLAAHLSPAEKEGAGQLAVLGVVFSREAARLWITDADTMIDALTFKGIVATSSTSVLAVNLKTSEHPPLVFTHSLTQGQMAERTQVDPDRLVDLIAASPPLYSIAPFQALFDHAGAVSNDSVHVRQAILEALTVARTLDQSAAWQKRVVPWGVATGLISRFVGEWDAEVCADMQAVLLRYDFFLHSRNPIDQGQLVDRILRFTAGHRSRPMCEARIVALAHWMKEHTDQADVVFGDIDDMLDRHLTLSGSSSYCYFLGQACDALIPVNDRGRLSLLERRLERAHTSAYLDDEGRRQLLESHLKLLTTFDTADDLRGRFLLLARIDTESGLLGRRVDLEKAELFLETGRIGEADVAAGHGIDYAQQRGLREELWRLQAIRLTIRAARGEPLEQIAADASRIIDSIPEGRSGAYRSAIGVPLADVALLRGEPDWAATLPAEYAGGIDQLSPHAHILLSLRQDHPKVGARPLVDKASPHQIAMATLVAMHDSGDSIGPEVVAVPFAAIADAQVLRVGDLLRLRAAIDLTIAIARRREGTPSQRSARVRAGTSSGSLQEGTPATEDGAMLSRSVHDALVAALNWMVEPTRSLDVFIAATLDDYGCYLSESEIETWRLHVERIRAERQERTQTSTHDERIVVTLLATMEMVRPDGTVEKLSGLRMRTLVGLMAANSMMRRPMDYPEFCRVAAGAESYDKAARVTTNGIVWRLREIVGHDAVDTSGETPTFDPRRIRIDLLESHELIDDATESIRSLRLVHAVSSLTSALHIIGTRVPFPNLYDDCFETLRGDFEARLQSTVVRLGGELMREGDTDGAVELLRLALETLPGDEGIEQLLASTAVTHHHRTSAPSVGT